MADYKRVISYMYNYENQEKRNNVGYARIETGGGTCKITIHIKVLSVSNNLKAYIYYRENGRMRGVFLTDLMIKNGVGECRVLTKANNMMDSNHSFDEMGGIIVYASSDKYFGTEWDDIPISCADMTLASSAQEEKEVEKLDTESKVEVEPERNKEPELMVKQKLEVEEKTSVQPEIDIKQEGRQEAEPEREITPFVCESGKKDMDEVFLRYPKMQPFEDENMIECIRIEPRDIGIFPIELWGLANNSFLLHGYYSYRHLIFAKHKEGNTYEYILGIPGIYHDREEFMAKMFGFQNFKSTKQSGGKIGEFGYWYIVLSL